MALTEEARARARQVAASLPRFTERERDELALLLRPHVLEAYKARRSPRPSGGGQTTA